MNMIDQAKQLREQAKAKAASDGKDWNEPTIRRESYEEAAAQTENPDGFKRIWLNWDRAARDVGQETASDNEGSAEHNTDENTKTSKRNRHAERYSVPELEARILRWREQAFAYEQRIVKKADAPESKKALWQTRIENAGRKVRHYERRLAQLNAKAA